jgi:hypothetical protein
MRVLPAKRRFALMEANAEATAAVAVPSRETQRIWSAIAAMPDPDGRFVG